jgi:ribosomal protein S18 acetylase RimI-like enzyme
MQLIFKTIKNPKTQRLKQIIKVYKDANWWYEYDNLRRLKKIIKGSFLFFVVLLNNDIIGIARIISDGINDAYIQDFTILKEFRNQGIGTKFLRFILKKLKNKGFKWIGLISQKRTVSLYRRSGFKVHRNKTAMIYEIKKT